MFEGLWNKLDGNDPLIRALRSSNDEKLTKAFLRSTFFFLNLPQGCEDGLDPNVSQEELLAHLRRCAQDLSRRKNSRRLVFSARIAVCCCSLLSPTS